MAGERPELRGLLRVLLCPAGPSGRFRARRERTEVAADGTAGTVGTEGIAGCGKEAAAGRSAHGGSTDSDADWERASEAGLCPPKGTGL